MDKRYYFIQYTGTTNSSWFRFLEEYQTYAEVLNDVLSKIDNLNWSSASRFRIVEVVINEDRDSSGDLVTKTEEYTYYYMDFYQEDIK